MRNPLLATFYDIDVLADDICHLWRSGSRHPLLWPGLPLDVYNQSASIAWDRLSPEDREARDAEAS